MLGGRIAEIESNSVVRVDHLHKAFGETKANVDICLDISAGCVHSILGENGAGKSTLLNQLYGLYRPDSGKIYIKGKESKFSSPAAALNSGLYLVAQNFSLVLPFTVRENIEILPTVHEILRRDKSSLEDLLSEIKVKTGLTVDFDAKVESLSMGERQKVEIVRGLATGATILMLDEPTSNLTPMESDNLFTFLNKLTQQNYTVIVTTHKLNEVMTHCDYVTVLRRGKVVSTHRIPDVTKDQLIEEIIGSSLVPETESESSAPRENELGLELGQIHYVSDVEGRSLRNIGLRVMKGEISGIAGVAGNGQVEIGLIAAGKLRPTKGKVLISGVDLTNESPRDFIQAGVSFIPDEGSATGIIPEMTVAENLSLTAYHSVHTKFGLMNLQEMNDRADNLIKEYDVRPPDKNRPAKLLSGGNLQKLILARELAANPKVLVAMNPTRGLDILTTELTHMAIIHQRDNGCAVLLISEDLEELLALCDNLSIIFRGNIVGSLTKDQINKLGSSALDKIGRKMVGETS